MIKDDGSWCSAYGIHQLLVKPMHKKLLKGTQWMPRRKIPMKDVEDCDKLRVAVKQAIIRRFPNGETRCESCRMHRYLNT